MRKLNLAIITSKYLVSFWSFGRSYLDKGKYMKHYRAYKRRKKIMGTEQYFNQKQNIIDIMKADEDDELYNQIN